MENQNDIEEQVPTQFQKDNAKASLSGDKYTFEDVLQYLGGYKYFSKERVMYVYLTVNGRVEEAEPYKAIIDLENLTLEEARKKLKTLEEIEELQKQATISLDEDNNDTKEIKI